MDVKRLTKIFHGHSRALDMPAGESFTPGALPAKFGEFPEHKIFRVVFFRIRNNACPRLIFFKYSTGELAVGGEAAGIEVHPIRENIREAFFLKALYELDLFRNMFARTRKDFPHSKIKFLKILFKRPRVEGANLFESCERFWFSSAAHCGDHFIFSFVTISRKMPNIGEVHYLLYLVAFHLERTAQNVRNSVGAQIADMRVVVDRWAAVIETSLTLLEWFKRFCFAR